MSQHAPLPMQKLPNAVRKQLLAARMAVERVEFVQATEQFRQQARPAQLLRQALSGAGLGALTPMASLLRVASFTRRHPYLGSLLGSTTSLLLRKRMARTVLSRLLKWGVAGGAIYGAIQFMRKDSAP